MSAAQVLFDFSARKPEELSITKGEMLTAVKKVSDDWCHGKNAAGRAGTFPSTYVVLIDLTKAKKQAIGKFEFVATKPDRISFAKGERIDVFAEVSSEWWLGRNAAGKTGLFPASYVVELDSSSSSGSSSKAGTVVLTPAVPATMTRQESAREKPFTSATLKDFPIQFKMPSQALPSLRIGQSDSTDGHAARNEAKQKLAELNALLESSK